MAAYSRQWRTHGAPRAAKNNGISDPASLTARLKKRGEFSVRVLSQAQCVLAPELAFGDPQRAHKIVRMREVVLFCDGQAVVFACSLFANKARGPLKNYWQRLANHPSQSLGERLFTMPRCQRGAFEYQRLDARSILYQKALAAAFNEPTAPPFLWARRSYFSLAGSANSEFLWLYEVFLPAFLAKPVANFEPKNTR